MNAIVNQASVSPTATAPNSETTRHVIVIIGAGFSGTALAIQLLRHATATPTSIVLVERNGSAGRGLAYASTSYPYLLNVPAGRMSINPHESLEFMHFARRKLPAVSAADFLPRALYGEYLQAVLHEARLGAPSHITLNTVTADVHRIDTAPIGTTSRVVFADGSVLHAHDVVLATGNPPPADLPGAVAVATHPAYAATPWSASRAFTARDQVLVVGTGLSMVDVVLKLSDDEQNTPQLHAISRRGLLPLSHAPATTTPALRDDFDALLWPATSVRQLVRATRHLSRALEHQGGSWREVIAYLRQIAPRVWQRLVVDERRRFTRHVQCYWDICRHLLPQVVSEHLRFVQHRGKLHIHAGRILHMQPEGERIRVRWRPRGHVQPQEAVFDGVINATGPDFNVQRARDPLLQALHADGVIAADPLRIGIRTDAHHAVIDQHGMRHRHLFYLGPLLRANDWETTAAPELFHYAEQLAEHLRHSVVAQTSATD